jgi:uncharacterized protein (DUF2252 family)
LKHFTVRFWGAASCDLLEWQFGTGNNLPQERNHRHGVHSATLALCTKHPTGTSDVQSRRRIHGSAHNPILSMTKPDDRSAALNRARNLKMARSAHAYVRGSTVKFYEWLEASAGKVPDGPPVWICGDCHVGNLGPLANAEGRVAVQIRDLDQTVIGNPAHDLIRLGLSLASAARGSNLPGMMTARILERLIDGYGSGLAGASDEGRIEVDCPESIEKLLKKSIRRRWKHLAEERLDTVKPVIPIGKKFWSLSKDERAALTELFAQEEVRILATSLKARDSSDPIELIDAAYWMKGCSSLGRLRFAVMLRIGEGEGSSICLMDVKEGVTAAAPRTPDAAMPRDNAVRVMTGAKALSPNLGGRLLPTRLLDKGVVIRELMPQDLKLEVDRLTPNEAVALAAYLAAVVGHAHGRQMDKDARAGWKREITASSDAKLDAPSWLWTSVVELLAIHEAAYLDHCRRFALADAA